MPIRVKNKSTIIKKSPLFIPQRPKSPKHVRYAGTFLTCVHHTAHIHAYKFTVLAGICLFAFVPDSEQEVPWITW